MLLGNIFTMMICCLVFMLLAMAQPPIETNTLSKPLQNPATYSKLLASPVKVKVKEQNTRVKTKKIDETAVMYSFLEEAIIHFMVCQKRLILNVCILISFLMD